MSLRSRLSRLERLLDELAPDPNRCPACGAPIPSVPGIIELRADGTLVAGGILEQTRTQCAECGGFGGFSARDYDPETGEIHGVVVVLCDPSRGLWMEESEWFQEFGDVAHGAPWDGWLEACRRGRQNDETQGTEQAKEPQ